MTTHKAYGRRSNAGHDYLPVGDSIAKQAEQLVSILQERLVSLIDLGLTLKHVHWNVRRPALHRRCTTRCSNPQYASCERAPSTRFAEQHHERWAADPRRTARVRS